MIAQAAQPDLLVWVKELGSLGILGFIVYMVATRIMQRLDNLVEVVQKHVTSMTDAVNAYKQLHAEHEQDMAQALSMLASHVHDIRAAVGLPATSNKRRDE